MNLLELRKLFRQLSGRFDLVNEDGSDNGANFFINEGRKFLDRLDETKDSESTHFATIPLGHFSLSFPYCRAVRNIWVATTSARWFLKRKHLKDLIATYLTTLPSSLSVGTPLYWAPCVTRLPTNELTVANVDAIVGYMDVPSGSTPDFNAIILDVPTEQSLTVGITGLFYSNELVEDTDTNYWSSSHPFLLYMSAMRALEINNRNTQGVNDWTNAILAEVRQLGFDYVESEIAEVNQIND